MRGEYANADSGKAEMARKWGTASPYNAKKNRRQWRNHYMLRILLLLFCSLPLHSSAEEKNPLRVAMVSEMQQVRAGQTFWLGFHFHHPPGYHSYWQHPGVVGLNTKVAWELPDGFHAGNIVWPAPQKLKMGAHTVQGYRGDVLLMVPITAPMELSEKQITFRAKLDWMCCGEGCHPAWNMPFSITVHTGENSLMNHDQQKSFATARQQVPPQDAGWIAQARYDEKEITLVMKPRPDHHRRAQDLGELWFFSADGAVHSGSPQKATIMADGSVEMKMKRFDFGPKKPAEIRGVLQASAGWQADGSVPCIEIIAPARKNGQ
jgi:DsbC/DsbD-like thiol-disulfide interchange protein